MIKSLFVMLLFCVVLVADILIIQTGQDKSYNTMGDEILDESLKDDGYYQEGLERNQTSNRDIDGNLIVLDNVTKLEWQDTKYPVFKSTPEEGRAYCASLDLHGSNWRMPTVNELESIRNLNYTYPAIGLEFTNYPNQAILTDTLNTQNNDEFWRINEIGNSVLYDEGAYIRCVRGDALDEDQGQYIRNANTIYNEKSNLTWLDSTDIAEQYLNWEEAIEYCETVSFAGTEDWRLPNINELITIADRSKYPATDTSYFKNMLINAPVWSSTTYAGNYKTQAKYFYPSTGAVANRNKDEGIDEHLICVRTGEISLLNINFLPSIIFFVLH